MSSRDDLRVGTPDDSRLDGVAIIGMSGRFPGAANVAEFWRNQLGDATDPLALPTDMRRTSATGFAGARESIAFDASSTAAIKRFIAQREPMFFPD